MKARLWSRTPIACATRGFELPVMFTLRPRGLQPAIAGANYAELRNVLAV